MVDQASRSDRGRFPLGLLGAIVLIVGVEQTIAQQKLGSLGGSQWSYEIARQVASSRQGGYDVVCFGDSLLKQGLAPTVMEAKAGLRAYNFAVAGGQAPGNYFLLRRALESGMKPRAVVVEYFPNLMLTDPDFNVENWPFLASPGDCLEMAQLTRDPNFLASLALRELFPSVRCRNSIRANILAALDGSFPTFAREINSARRNWEVNRGAEIIASRPGRIEDVESWMHGYFPRFDCSRTNRAYIKKLLELARSHEIPVFWLLPPYKPELQARCEQSGFDQAHETFIKGLQARYPGLYVIDGRRAGYDPDVFSDLHHLGREGAAIFSSEVAFLLLRHREGPASTSRWLELPRYRSLVAATTPIEDMDESRRRVHKLASQNDATLKR